MTVNHFVIWNTQVPCVRVRDKTPKVKVIFGPSRYPLERRLPANCGANRGAGNPRKGISLRDIRSGRRHLDQKPLSYSEK